MSVESSRGSRSKLSSRPAKALVNSVRPRFTTQAASGFGSTSRKPNRIRRIVDSVPGSLTASHCHSQ
jgi:hypothetical protein